MLLCLKRAVRSRAPTSPQRCASPPTAEVSGGKGTKMQHGGFKMLNLENISTTPIVKAMKEDSEISYSESIQIFSQAGFVWKFGCRNFHTIAKFCYKAITS